MIVYKEKILKNHNMRNSKKEENDVTFQQKKCQGFFKIREISFILAFKKTQHKPKDGF